MVNKRKIIFRVDANNSIGMGHLIRCYSLAKMLESVFEINFLVSSTSFDITEKYLDKSYKLSLMPVLSQNEELQFVKKHLITEDAFALVLDGYQFNSDYQKNVHLSNFKIIYIDDLIAFNYNVDVIINQAENVKETDYKTSSPLKFCLGAKYILLREPFLKAAQSNRQLKKIESVFVSFGGADMDNVSQKVVKTLLKFPQLKNIHVLSSSVNENIDKWKNEFGNSSVIKFHNDLNAEEVCSLMQSCELALGPCSNLALELCSIGIVFITGATADNQNNYYKALTANSAVLGIGKWQELSEETLNEKLSSVMIYDKKDLDWFVKNQRNYIDGQSGKRLLDVFIELAKN